MPAVLIVIYLLAGQPPVKMMVPAPSMAICESFRAEMLKSIVSRNRASRYAVTCVEPEPEDQAEPTAAPASKGSAI